MQFYLAWIGIVRLMSEQCATTWLENVVGDLPRLLLAHTVAPYFGIGNFISQLHLWTWRIVLPLKSWSELIMKSFVRYVYMFAGPRTSPFPKGSPNCPRTPVTGDRSHICICNSLLARNTNNPGKTVPNGFEDSQILEDFLSLPQVVLVANQEYALLQRKGTD